MSKVIFQKASHTYMENTSVEQRALIDIDLTIEEGKIHTIIGHTGSGKSTLVKHINGLLRADEGKVIVDGYQIKKTNKKQSQLKTIRQKASIVFQFPELQLFAETVEKDVMFGPLCFGKTQQQAKELAHKYIKLVGLPSNLLQQSPFELSGGQKRRVAIAGILAVQPEVLIIDEPAAGLDPVGKQEIMSIFQNLNQKGMTIILVTHNMDDVWKYSDTVTLLNKGRVVFNGTTETLFSNKDLLENNSIGFPKHIEFINELKQETGIDVPISFDTPEKIVKYILDFKVGK